MHPPLYPTNSHTSANTTSTEPDLSPHYVGTCHNIAATSSGSISLGLSLQQDSVFLASPIYSPSTYEEQDNGIPPSAGDSERNYNSLNENFPDQSASSILNTFANISLNGNSSQSNGGMGPQDYLHTSSLSSTSSPSDLPPSILRGSLIMKLKKPTKIKNISLRFYGKCKTGWLDVDRSKRPDAPSSCPQFQDEVIINSHTWEYVPARAGQGSSISIMNKESVVTSDLYGADVAYTIGENQRSGTKAVPGEVSFKTPIEGTSANVGGVGIDNLKTCVTTLSHNNIPFFTPQYFSEVPSGKKPSTKHSFSTHTDSTTYPQGEYVFHFNLAIDARTAETIVSANGAIKYYLVAKLERPSKFTFAITGHKEVLLVRSPPNAGEVTSNTPLSISRDWDDKLHYEIQCPKRYIPLGSSIPLSIKLTPIEKIRVHRLRLSIIESIDYISSKSSHIKYHEPPRKVLLFQKNAGDPEKSGGTEAEIKKKTKIAMMAGNMLNYTDDISSGDEKHPESRQIIPSTTCMDITLPFVTSDSSWDSQANHHYTLLGSDSKYFQFLRPDAVFNPFIHIRHRLHVSFRISILDTRPQPDKKPSDEPTWRYFEVLVDSPIHFLHKDCQTESVELPSYSGALADVRVDEEGNDGYVFNMQPPEPPQPVKPTTPPPVATAKAEQSVESPSVQPQFRLSLSKNTKSSGKFRRTIDIGAPSPKVLPIHSPFAVTPVVEGGASYFNLGDPLMHQPPSFDDALNSQLYGLVPKAAKAPTEESINEESEDSSFRYNSGKNSEMSRQSSSVDITSAGTQADIPLHSPPKYESIDRTASPSPVRRADTPPRSSKPSRPTISRTTSSNSYLGIFSRAERTERSARTNPVTRQLQRNLAESRSRSRFGGDRRAEREQNESYDSQEETDMGGLGKYSDLPGAGP